jgi:hypothetical protein
MDIQLRNEEPQTCPATGYQSVSVCVPVTVEPFASPGTTVTKCCGDPIVRMGADAICQGVRNGSCSFTITQDICVEVPVLFGARTVVGDTFVACRGSSATNNCCEEHK